MGSLPQAPPASEDDADAAAGSRSVGDAVPDASTDPEAGDGTDATSGTDIHPGHPEWNRETRAQIPVDEVYFYCRVQPIVIDALGCATGGRCHSRRSSLRLSSVTLSEAPLCEGDRIASPVPDGYRENYLASRRYVRPGDAARSAFLLRALGRSHPVDAILPDSVEAEIVTTFIEGSR